MSTDRVVLSPNVIPLHYELTISTKMKDDFIFSGRVDIALRITEKNLTSITLHTKDLTIHTCVLFGCDGKPLKSSGSTFNEADEMRTFEFDSPIPEGDARMEIEYTGCHNDEMNGFYRSGYKGNDGTQKTMISTQFEPLDARRCFPCVDEPAAKAEFTCALVVDAGLTALSNMPVIETATIKEGKDKGRVKVSFAKSPKMSTYLLAFCVGEFDYVEKTTSHGVLLRVYTVSDKSKCNFALDAGVKSLDLYDDMFGQPFPLPKMDMIAVPDFAMGAMENWGLITYREVDLLIDESAGSQQKQRVATVVAHELAHQWFGNLVTMAWWDDLWLNEGFATWMQNYATDLGYPEYKLWEQFVANEQAMALSLDSLLSSHPIQVPIRRAQEVEEVFDAISYRKGGSVVHLIHAFLGHEMFVKGLQLYMDRHKYGNTVTHDLWKAWEEVSGTPVSKIMASWTEQMGFPVLHVLSSKAAGENQLSIEVEQQWFLADGKVPDDGKDKTWFLPQFVVSDAGMEKKDLFSDKKGTITIKVPDNGWFKLNAGQFVPMRVNYTDDMWRSLAVAIGEKKVSVVDRAALLMDAYALVKAGMLDPVILLELLQAFKGETEYVVWDAISSALHGLQKVLDEQTELVLMFEGFAKHLIYPALEAVGWEGKESDGHLGKLLRTLLISLAMTFAPSDPLILAEAKKRFDAYVADPKKDGPKMLPSEYRTTVFRIVLKASKSSTEYDQLFKLIDVVDSTVEKKDIYLALGFVADPALKLKTLDWTTSGAVKKQDFFYAIASCSMSGPAGVDLTWKYLQDNFAKYEEFLKTASPSLMAAVIMYSASGFTSFEKADEIENFFANHPTKAARKVDQVVESTRNAAKFKELILSSTDLKTFLEKQAV